MSINYKKVNIWGHLAVLATTLGRDYSMLQIFLILFFIFNICHPSTHRGKYSGRQVWTMKEGEIKWIFSCDKVAQPTNTSIVIAGNYAGAWALYFDLVNLIGMYHTIIWSFLFHYQHKKRILRNIKDEVRFSIYVQIW